VLTIRLPVFDLGTSIRKVEVWKKPGNLY